MAGLVACGLYIGLKDGFKGLELDRGNAGWLGGAGVVNTVAWITVTMAINLGRVSVASSARASIVNPLFSILLSRVFLRDERYDRYMVLGSLLIVLGVAVVSILG